NLFLAGRRGSGKVENTKEYAEHLEKLQAALENEQIDALREEIIDMHPYEQAMFFMEQPAEMRMKVYAYLSPEEVAEIMENIELDHTVPLFIEMDPRFASMVFAEMAADDAVDILNKMDKDKVASFLTIRDQE